MSDGIGSYLGGPRPMRPVHGTGAYFSPEPFRPVPGTNGLGAYFSPEPLRPIPGTDGLGAYTRLATRRGFGSIDFKSPAILVGCLLAVGAAIIWMRKK